LPSTKLLALLGLLMSMPFGLLGYLNIVHNLMTFGRPSMTNHEPTITLPMQVKAAPTVTFAETAS